MNLNDIFTQIIYTTVPIWVENKNGDMKVGTGFFYQEKIDDHTSIPFIVTNAHVVENANKGYVSLIQSQDNMPILSKKVTAELPGTMLSNFTDSKNDIAVITIGPILNQLNQSNISIFFRAIDESIVPNSDTVSNLSAVEEITFIGYPSGIYDRKNNTPIVRRGITATPIWNNFNGKNVFLIDAGVYPGSSGSPVLIINKGSYSTNDGITIGTRVIFLGVVSKTMQRTEFSNHVYLGLGEVVKSTFLKEYITTISKSIKVSAKSNMF